MGYVEDNLISGETILYRTRVHWWVLFWPSFAAAWLCLLSLPLLADSSTTGIGLFLLITAVATLALAIVFRTATEIAVTNRRVLIKSGVLKRKTLELLLSKIESIGVEESIFGRLLGYGTVVVRGTGGTPEPFKKIAHPIEFRRQVQQQIEAVAGTARP